MINARGHALELILIHLPINYRKTYLLQSKCSVDSFFSVLILCLIFFIYVPMHALNSDANDILLSVRMVLVPI